MAVYLKLIVGRQSESVSLSVILGAMLVSLQLVQCYTLVHLGK